MRIPNCMKVCKILYFVKKLKLDVSIIIPVQLCQQQQHQHQQQHQQQHQVYSSGPRPFGVSSSDEEIRSTPECTSCGEEEMESESVSEKGRPYFQLLQYNI